MKILLIGEYFSQNLGDPVLCQTVEHSIMDAFPDAQVIPFDMSGKTGFDTYFNPTRYSPAQKWYFRLAYRAPFFLNRFPLCRVIQQDTDRYMRTMCMLDIVLEQGAFDLAIFAGGSIFMDYFAGIIYGIVSRLNRKKIPIIFHACGMSGLTEDTSYVLQKALNYKNIKSISLRDSHSRFLNQFHVNVSVTETFDTAMACSKYFSPNQATFADIGVGIIGIPAYYEFQKVLIHTVHQSGETWKLFTNGSPHDREIAISLLNDLDIPSSEKFIVRNPRNAEELINTVTGFRKIVSFRMHSQIVATSYGIPSFGFVWDDKIKDFYTKIGMPSNCKKPNAPISWREIESRLCVDGERLRDLAVNAGESSQKSLIEQIREQYNEVAL